MDDAELQLLSRTVGYLNKRLGNFLVIWEFTASFCSDGSWVARMDYTLEGEASSKMKGLFIQGYNDKIDTINQIRPRVFMIRPSIVRLRAGMLELEVQNPDMGERID